VAHCPAVADQIAFAAEGFLHQVAGDGALAFAGLLQRADQRDVAQRCRRQRGERADGRVGNAVEGTLVQRIERKDADQLAVDVQAAAEAGVHPLFALRVAGQQAVEGVRHVAVGRKTHRGVGFENRRQARVSLRVEAPPHQIGRQSDAGHRNQGAFLQVQQRDGVAWQHRADRRDQPLELDFAGHRVGEIDGNLPQGAVDGFLETHVMNGTRRTDAEYRSVGTTLNMIWIAIHPSGESRRSRSEVPET